MAARGDLVAKVHVARDTFAGERAGGGATRRRRAPRSFNASRALGGLSGRQIGDLQLLALLACPTKEAIAGQS